VSDSGAAAGIPFVMTNATKTALRERGYSDAAIAELTPADARKIIGNGAEPTPRTAIAEITVFTKRGGPLTKHIELVDGRIANDSSLCGMGAGAARRVQINLNDIAALAKLINGLGPREAYGVGRLREGLRDRVRIVVADKLADFHGDPGVAARTKVDLVFAAGAPAICPHDVDLKGMPEEAKRRIRERGVWAALCDVVPPLANAARVIRASTSHGLRNKDTGQTYPSSGGFHAAVAVADGADIPRYLADLHDRLWLAGWGWGFLSAPGSFLERSLVDRSCGSAERLIFEAAPVVVPPLEQGPRLAEAFEGAILDTRAACPPLTADEQAEVKRLKEAERLRLKPQSAEARAKWSESHIRRSVAAGMPEPWARAQVDRWIDRQELSGDFPLAFDDPKLAGATVADVLAKPDKFINKTLADPFEGPAYGRGKAILYQRANGSLFINSFAHGGIQYELKAAPRPDVDAEIERLARLPPLDYDLARESAAKRLGARVTSLDKAVETKRNAKSTGKPPAGEAEAILNEIGADHAVVMVGARCRVLRFEDTPHFAGGEHYVYRLPTFVRFDDFRNFYLNRLTCDAGGAPFAVDAKGNPLPIGEWWLGHQKRRQYRGVIFLPGGAPVVEDRLNLWTGFGVAAKRGKWERMKEHVFEVLAAGDNEVNEYIHNWLADAVQHPDRQAEVALVFLGGLGTGRGLLGRAMCRIFGQHGRHISSPEHLTGKFNAHMQQCCFLFADEAFAPQDRKAEGVLKRLITEPTLFIEPKGVDSFEVPNPLHVILASNHEWVVQASEKERRYVAQNVAHAHQQDEEWFKPIYEELSNGGLEAMLYDLLARDLGDWRPRKIVRTAALGRQQDESLNPLDQWWLELLHTGVLAGVADKFAPDQAVSNAYEEEVVAFTDSFGAQHMRTARREGLYDQARRISPKLKGVSDTALGRYLRDHGCVNVSPMRARRGWRFPLLSVCRDQWVARFPHTVWADPSPADWTLGEVDE